MKCEICQKAEAATVLVRGEGDEAEELYVCAECARAERQRRQKKSQRTRKISGLPPGVSMSITRISGDDSDEGEAPPQFAALMNAFSDVIADIEKTIKSGHGKRVEPEYHEFPVNRVEAAYRIGNRLHLEGLHLIGEIGAVKRALHALRMELVDVRSDGLRDVGHVYTLRYSGSSEQAKRVLRDILREERNARVRLFEELHRVFGDALCRALAIIKNCRLLSPAEYFDLLSPLRLAAKEGMLDGIDSAEIERRLRSVDLSGYEDRLTQDERDRADAERADEMNRRFEDVMLNERGEERFL